MGKKDVGFITMTSEEKILNDIPEIGIGLIGHAFMGKAHSNAWKKMPYIFWPPPAFPKLISICGIPEESVAVASKRYEFNEYTTDWHKVIENDKVEVVDIVTPNYLHSDPAIEAANAGKHIICEKPLGRNAYEAKMMLDAVKKNKVLNICGFNYRMVPAIILAKNLIAAGKLGNIFHFRATYLQEWIADPSFPMIWKLKKEFSGCGALGDLGSHIIDLGRFLCGEIVSVMAVSRTFIKERYNEEENKKEKVDVDDAIASVIEFKNGAIGTIEASRFCLGRKNYNRIEINGEKGSIWWDLENMNNLWVYWKDGKPEDTRGFSCVNVTEAYHPYYENWWPHGHIIGWENLFVHEVYSMAKAIKGDQKLDSHVPTFEDGYRTCVICDSIIESSEKGRKIICTYDF